MGYTIERIEYTTLDAGLYSSVIEGITKEAGRYGDQFKITYRIDEEGFEGKVVTGWVSCSFSRKSRFFRLVRAAVFGGRDIPEAVRAIDTDSLLGRRLVLSIDTVKGDTGEVFNKVVDFLPYRHRTPQPIQPPTPAAQSAQPPTPNAQPPAVTTRATGQAPSRPSEPPDWPGWDQTSLPEPEPDLGGEN